MGRDFKVGDIVKGNSETRYNLTDADMTEARVIDTDCVGGKIRIEVLKHEQEAGIGQEFIVDPEYFELVRREEPPTGGSELELVDDSKMAQVARILGEELGKEFYIVGGRCNPYKLTENGLFDSYDQLATVVLSELLIGKLEIKKPTCAHCGGTNEVIQQGNAPMCKQCAKEVLAK